MRARLPLLLSALAALIAAHATAQRDGKPKKPRKRLVDPYTKNDDEAMQNAGYVSFGPFPFGKDHNTDDIEHVLGLENQILWVETAHFRLGCRLGTYRVPRTDRYEKKRIRKELTELSKKLPNIKKSKTTLDGWLRLHLYAHRLESLYGDLMRRLDLKDDSFPGKDGKGKHTEYMGKGPYFGMQSKFTVLLFTKASTLSNYCKTFQSRKIEADSRFNDIKFGTLFYGAAIEFSDGNFRSETGIHCGLVHNTTHNLIDGYRYYWYALPNWFKEGLAHWYTRRVDPEFVRLETKTTYELKPERRWNWEPRIRALVGFDTFPRAEQLCRICKLGQIEFKEHMMSWSRVDYLMTLGDEALRTYLHHMKGIPVTTALPTRDEILARQRAAMQMAWKLDMPTFDARWKAWVLKNYKRK